MLILKKKKTIALMALMLLLCTLLGCGASKAEKETIKENRALLKQSILEKASEYTVLSLSEITPFEWDKVYIFPAYATSGYMYGKVGYFWDKIPYIVTHETMMQIVFMNEGRVVCFIYGDNQSYDDEYNVGYGFYSYEEELLASDDPKFVVSDLSSDYVGPTLSWFDESLIDPEQFNDIPEAIVGEWGYWIQGNGSLSFVLTKEGLVTGDLSYNGTKEHEGGGGTYIIGTFDYDSGIAHCRTYPYEDVEFDIAFNGTDQFKLNVDFSEELDFHYMDGVPVDMDGEIIIEKLD